MRKYFIIAVILTIISDNAYGSIAKGDSSYSNFLSSEINQFPNGNQMDAAMSAILLEEFCKRFYSGWFKDRIYIQNTIKVGSVTEDPQTGNFLVKGVHSYQGKNIPFVGRKSHIDIPFQAVMAIGLQGVQVTFYKWSEPDYSHPNGYWEQGTNFLSY